VALPVTLTFSSLALELPEDVFVAVPPAPPLEKEVA
jgi:hypothetical protein